MSTPPTVTFPHNGFVSPSPCAQPQYIPNFNQQFSQYMQMMQAAAAARQFGDQRGMGTVTPTNQHCWSHECIVTEWEPSSEQRS